MGKENDQLAHRWPLTPFSAMVTSSFAFLHSPFLFYVYGGLNTNKENKALPTADKLDGSSTPLGYQSR